MVHSEETKRKISETHGLKSGRIGFDELFDLYWNEKLTLAAIGTKLKKPKSTVYGWMKHHKIPTRTTGEAQIGRRLSEEHKRKISEANRGENNPHWGKRGKECAWYGRTQSDEEREMRRQLVLGPKNPMYGKPSWSRGLTKENSLGLMKISQKLRGRKLSKDWREKISKARIGKYGGKNHPNWHGGLKDKPYGAEFNESLRQQIRKRDGFVCQLCEGINDDRELQVHHINYDKMDNCLENLISLCLRCHVKTNYNRDFWIDHFKILYSRGGDK